MSFVLCSASKPTVWKLKAVAVKPPSPSLSTVLLFRKRRLQVKVFCFNPSDEPILKEAFNEPVAFMGGMFAGLLRLDLNEDPLKEWISRTVEASGVTEVDDMDIDGSKPEEAPSPQQIEIE
ncbi:hypothetical protein NMG60_11031045 [Bertholletia excelsa]